MNTKVRSCPSPAQNPAVLSQDKPKSSNGLPGPAQLGPWLLPDLIITGLLTFTGLQPHWHFSCSWNTLSMFLPLGLFFFFFFALVPASGPLHLFPWPFLRSLQCLFPHFTQVSDQIHFLKKFSLTMDSNLTFFHVSLYPLSHIYSFLTHHHLTCLLPVSSHLVVNSYRYEFSFYLVTALSPMLSTVPES